MNSVTLYRPSIWNRFLIVLLVAIASMGILMSINMYHEKEKAESERAVAAYYLENERIWSQTLSKALAVKIADVERKETELANVNRKLQAALIPEATVAEVLDNHVWSPIKNTYHKVTDWFME